MPTGSCFCGKVKVEYTGEPAMTALCHCADCRKISGGNYSNNIVVPSENFKVLSGTPKTIEKTADTGKSITSNFCGDCGTTLFRYGDSFGGPDGMRIIKAGILDDVNVINNTKPGAELFAPDRIKASSPHRLCLIPWSDISQWVPAMEGAGQIDAMPPS